MEPVKKREPRLEIHLGYWLRRVSNHVSGAFARALQTKHTSVAEWVMLCHFEERPGITPGELAEAINLTRGAVSKVIDKLEAKNWITRSINPNDSRIQLLRLTPAGSRNLPQLTKIADQNDKEFFAGLKTDERAILQRLLGKLVHCHQITSVPIE